VAEELMHKVVYGIDRYSGNKYFFKFRFIVNTNALKFSMD